MKRMRADLIAEIKTALYEAKVNAYENIVAKRYDYWRAIASYATYDETLAMFEQGTEHKIPDMATEAVADFERAREGEIPVPEMTLAVADGRRVALASVAEWMSNR